MQNIINNTYNSLLNAKAAEGLKRDTYAKSQKLYDSTTYQWIITAMSHLDELQTLTRKS